MSMILPMVELGIPSVQELWVKERNKAFSRLSEIREKYPNPLDVRNIYDPVQKAVIKIFSGYGYEVKPTDEIPRLYSRVLDIIAGQLPEFSPPGFHVSNGFLGHSTSFHGLTPRQCEILLLTLGYQAEMTLIQWAKEVGCKPQQFTKQLTSAQNRLALNKGLRDSVLQNPRELPHRLFVTEWE